MKQKFSHISDCRVSIAKIKLEYQAPSYFLSDVIDHCPIQKKTIN